MFSQTATLYEDESVLGETNSCKGYFKRGGQSLSRHVLRRATPRSFFSHYCCYRDRAGSVCVKKRRTTACRAEARRRFSPLVSFAHKPFTLFQKKCNLWLIVSCERFQGWRVTPFDWAAFEPASLSTSLVLVRRQGQKQDIAATGWTWEEERKRGN